MVCFASTTLSNDGKSILENKKNISILFKWYQTHHGFEPWCSFATTNFKLKISQFMETAWHGNTFCINNHLWVQSTGHRQVSFTMGLWYFLHVTLKKLFNKQSNCCFFISCHIIVMSRYHTCIVKPICIMPADLKSRRYPYRLIYALYGNIRPSVSMSSYRQLNSSLCLYIKQKACLVTWIRELCGFIVLAVWWSSAFDFYIQKSIPSFM